MRPASILPALLLSCATSAAPAARTASEIRLDVCGQTRTLSMLPPHGPTGGRVVTAGLAVGDIRAGVALLPEALQSYGWVGSWTPQPGEPTLFWFNLPGSLPDALLREDIQAQFSCESYGGSGHVYLKEGMPVEVVLRDPRFTAASGAQVGRTRAEVRDALCAAGQYCAEEAAQVGADWLLQTEQSGTLAIRDEEVVEWRVPLVYASSTELAALRPVEGRLPVPDELRMCAVDADCANVSVTGGNCGGDCAAISRAYEPRFVAALQHYDLRSPVTCSYDCRSPWQTARCVAGRCQE